ncbi:unnamed protein product [Merluccius merluccius]
MGEVRDKPIVAYVGDSVVLECKMEDTKPKPNTWNWYRANETEKDLINPEADPLRYGVQNKEGKTRLTVHNLTEVDAGAYYCGAVYDISITMSRVDLRIITFMEPLKPFLFIVVEVLVLVSIILLYERGKSQGSQPMGGSPDDSCAVDTDTSTTTRQRKV